MKSVLSPARMIGLLFLLAFVLYGVGNGLVTASPELNDPPITQLAYELTRWAGYVLVALNSVAVIVIATLLFPILKRYSNRVAITYLVARIIEAILLLIGALSPGNTWAYQTAMLVLGLGSIGFCYVLTRTRLVPQTLSVLGIAGYVGLAIGMLCDLFGPPIGLVLLVPGALFELCFSLLLLVKGFTASELPESTGD